MLYFLLFLGGLIFFHELGHFLAARLVGVTVLRFSIGFGPKILGFKRGVTEYWLSALPLGGYVKFMGDDPEDPPAPEDARKGFLTTDTWRKFLIVIAGPAFNLVLPFLVFLPMYLAESQLPPAILGTTAIDGAAWTAGMRPGDRVTAIEDRPVAYWWEMVDIVSDNPDKPLAFRVDRNGVEKSFTVTPRPVVSSGLRDIGLTSTVGRIEVAPDRSLPIVIPVSGSPAEQAGIRPFDAIRSVDGRMVHSFDEVVSALKASNDRSVTMEVAATITGSITPEETRSISLGPVGRDASPGIEDGQFVLESVNPDSPAGRAGLLAGDRILLMDGRRYTDWGFLLESMARDPGLERTFYILRDGRELSVVASLANPAWEPGAAVPRYQTLGAVTRRAIVLPDPIPNDDRLYYGVNRAWTRTKDIFVVTIAGIGALVTGRVSVKEMGGPIMIYDIASSAGRRGWTEFFGALAWLSMSLGVLNLLPIPVLDGGHLVMFSIEAIRRKPMGRRGRQIASYIGLAFLLTLMVLVFANDISRKWGALSGLGLGG
jgi:regulator of sigma E protease